MSHKAAATNATVTRKLLGFWFGDVMVRLGLRIGNVMIGSEGRSQNLTETWAKHVAQFSSKLKTFLAVAYLPLHKEVIHTNFAMVAVFAYVIYISYFTIYLPWSY